MVSDELKSQSNGWSFWFMVTGLFASGFPTIHWYSINTKTAYCRWPEYFHWQPVKRWLIRQPQKVWGQMIHLAASKKRSDPMMMICNVEPWPAIEDYLQRWQIETMFQAMKGWGFNLEENHPKDRNEISKLNDFRHSRKLIRGRPQRAIIAPMGASQNPCSLA